jgi:hypothetical protein
LFAIAEPHQRENEQLRSLRNLFFLAGIVATILACPNPRLGKPAGKQTHDSIQKLAQIHAHPSDGIIQKHLTDNPAFLNLLPR